MVFIQYGLCPYIGRAYFGDELIGQIPQYCYIWYDNITALLINGKTIQSHFRINFSVLYQWLSRLCITDQSSSSHCSIYADRSRLSNISSSRVKDEIKYQQWNWNKWRGVSNKFLKRGINLLYEPKWVTGRFSLWWQKIQYDRKRYLFNNSAYAWCEKT
jgi:hypothetical protein